MVAFKHGGRLERVACGDGGRLRLHPLHLVHGTSRSYRARLGECGHRPAHGGGDRGSSFRDRHR